MKFQRKKVATALAYMLGVGSVTLLTATHAQAQNTNTPQADIKVEVTGSNIKRVEGESALPVTILTRKEIDKTGATTATELLQFISANNTLGQVNLQNTLGATFYSQQGASLRGLGAAFTLVLVNGHRLESVAGAVGAFEGGVNLSVIPFDAIERVEILKDGASAIYGSDAVAGVINFILRKDFHGVTATAQYGTPSASGGGQQWFANSTVGFGDLSKDRYNVVMSGQYEEQKSLDTNKRSYADTSYLPLIGLNSTSGNTFPGYISTGGIGNPNFPDCGNGNIALGGRCRADPEALNGVNLVPDDKKWNFFASGSWQLTRDWQAYATGLYSDEKTRIVIQPVPISDQVTYGTLGQFNSTILLPPTSPYYPHDLAQQAGVDGQPLNIRYRANGVGLRDTTDESSGGQAIVGIKGTWKDWDWDASGFYAEGTTTESLNGGFPQYSLALPLLNSGNVNPFGPSTPAFDAQLAATSLTGQTFKGTSKNYGVGGKTTGEIWTLPAGAVSLAAGLDVRKESLVQDFVPQLGTGDVSGFGGSFNGFNVSRNVWDAYTEFNIPIVKTLEGDVAVRYDHYSDFGSTTNPKFSLRWQPMSQVLLRTSYNTGFAAPTLYELNLPLAAGLTAPIDDPVRCPVTGKDADCQHQFGLTFGGSKDLQPQTSRQWGFGAVIEPFTGLSMSVDYFNINLKNQITNGINYTTILANQTQYNSQITRGPVDTPGLPGPITNIPAEYLNLTATHITGYDVDARYQTPISWLGRFTFNIAGTYYINYRTQNVDGSWNDQVGNMYGSALTGVTPRWKDYATVTWEQGPWTATLANNYQTSYIDSQTDADGNLRRVGSLSIWDLQGSYSGFKNVTLTLGVKNLYNTNPPVTNQIGTFVYGFDPSYYDSRGQFYYGSIKYTFK